MKYDIPLLEYDPDPKAVVTPDHEHMAMELPERVVFAFLGDTVDDYAQEHGARIISNFVSATKDYPLYVLNHAGEQFGLMQAPVGAPAAVQILDWLIGYGAKKVISAGSCGTLEELDENVILVPSRALRDEGTSYHYLPASRYVEISMTAKKVIELVLNEYNLPYREVTTWSTDGFFRETPGKVTSRRQEGCSVVEMECSALAACAAFRGIEWGEILYTGDTLSNLEAYDERNFGRDSRALALQLCVDAVMKI